MQTVPSPFSFITSPPIHTGLTSWMPLIGMLCSTPSAHGLVLFCALPGTSFLVSCYQTISHFELFPNLNPYQFVQIHEFFADYSTHSDSSFLWNSCIIVKLFEFMFYILIHSICITCLLCASNEHIYFCFNDTCILFL